MKIISNFKDYYDYYSGIFGEDPLKVLDRTKDYKHITDNNILLFYCGKWYRKGLTKNIREHHYFKWFQDKDFFTRFIFNIVYKDNEIYWGEIINFDEAKFTRFTDDTLEIINKSNKPYFIVANYSYNIKKRKYLYKTFYPVLKELEFNKVFEAKDCYLQIEQYISKQDLEVNSNPDDKIRLEQKGFDNKISFRHRK